MGVIVNLPPDLEDRLRARVAAGEFTSLEAAVSEAVRQFDLTQPPSEELRAAVAEGLAQSLDEIEPIARLLADNAMLGAARNELGPGVRTFVAARIFVVAYRVLEDGVDVLAVVHHARDVRRVLRDI